MWQIELARRHDLHGVNRVSLLAAVLVTVPRGTAQLQQSSSRQLERRTGG